MAYKGELPGLQFTVRDLVWFTLVIMAFLVSEARVRTRVERLQVQVNTLETRLYDGQTHKLNHPR